MKHSQAEWTKQGHDYLLCWILLNSRNKPTMPVINDIKEIKTPKDCGIRLCRRWWIRIQEERTDDGASVQTLQTSAIDIGKLVSGYYRFKIQFQMYALILQNCTAHKGCCCLHFALIRRGINISNTERSYRQSTDPTSAYTGISVWFTMWNGH